MKKIITLLLFPIIPVLTLLGEQKITGKDIQAIAEEISYESLTKLVEIVRSSEEKDVIGHYAFAKIDEIYIPRGAASEWKGESFLDWNDLREFVLSQDEETLKSWVSVGLGRKESLPENLELARKYAKQLNEAIDGIDKFSKVKFSESSADFGSIRMEGVLRSEKDKNELNRILLRQGCTLPIAWGVKVIEPNGTGQPM